MVIRFTESSPCSGRWYSLAAENGDAEMELALARVYLQELDGRELDIEKCLYYAKSAADKGHPEAQVLYRFVSGIQALRAKGILTGDEDADEMLRKAQEAAGNGDKNALAMFG